MNDFDSATVVVNWLLQRGFTVCVEQEFEGLMGDYENLRFDIWLPHYNTCIEVDGQQHYQLCKNDSLEAFLKKREYGRRKELFCSKHGLLLVRIVYDELNHLDQSLKFLFYNSNRPRILQTAEPIAIYKSENIKYPQPQQVVQAQVVSQ